MRALGITHHTTALRWYVPNQLAHDGWCWPSSRIGHGRQTDRHGCEIGDEVSRRSENAEARDGNTFLCSDSPEGQMQE